jgi:uncharacterized protein (TIGR02231 family)
VSEPVRIHAPKSISARATAVRLYEDRAEVNRTGTIDLSKGTQWVAVAGVSALLDDKSVQADVRADGARVISARVLRRVRDPDDIVVTDAAALEKRAESLLDRHHAAQRTELRAHAALTRSDGAVVDWLSGLSRVPDLTDPQTRTRWIEAFKALVEADERALADSLAGAREKEDVSETASALLAKLTSLRAEQPEIDAVIEVQIHAEHPGPADLHVRYRTPCAVWRPEHLARMTNDEKGGARIELTTFAAVWQATGEDWSEVEVEFSTARPARAATAPLLDEDRVRSRKKTEEERRTIVVEQREQEIQVAGIGDRVRAVDEMPGVDDGGEPLTYRASGRVTLPSTGRPYRVELSRASFDAACTRILVPEKTPVAHWRAAATLTTPHPLLAGPVRVNRFGSMMGRSKTDFVGRGEAFELGFGPDDSVRARRKQTEKRDRTMLIGTQKIDRVVRLYLSNLSGETKEVTVLERIPVSEIEEVEIALTEGGADWNHNARDGFLRRKVLLGARETKEIGYSYEIRAKSNVELPF